MKEYIFNMSYRGWNWRIRDSKELQLANGSLDVSQALKSPRLR